MLLTYLCRNDQNMIFFSHFQKDRLLIASSEMTVLSDQLEQLRTDKHKAEVEHVRKERERDLEVEALSKEKAALSQLKSELEEKVQKQSAELTNARTEIAKLGTIYILHAYRYLHTYMYILFQL